MHALIYALIYALMYALTQKNADNALTVYMYMAMHGLTV